MTLKDWIDIAQSVTVIAASIVAVYGINAWRREFIGKRKIELAEEVLALFYQTSDIVAYIRSPGGFSGEACTRESGADETPDEKRIRNAVYIIFKRYDQHAEVFSRIHALRYRFMAQFGSDAVAPFNKLKSVLNEVRGAAEQWTMLSNVDERTFSNPQSLQAHRAQIEKYGAILWGMEKDDTVSLRLGEAIEDIERMCRPHIDRNEKRVSLFMRLASRWKATNLPI